MVLKALITAFIKQNGRNPNAVELLKLKFKAANQSGKGKVFDLTGKQIDTSKPIIGGKNVAETEAQIKARMIKENRSNVQKSYLRQLDKKIMDEMDMTAKEMENMSSTALDDLRRNADPVGMKKQFDEITEGRGLGDFADDSDFFKDDYASGGLARVGMFLGGPIVKGGNWFLKALRDTRKLMTQNKQHSPEQLKYYLSQIDDQIKNIEAGGKIPDEVIQTIRKDPKFKSVSQKSTNDPDLREIEEVLLEYGEKHASGGIAGQLHLNQGGRVRYGSGSAAPNPNVLTPTGSFEDNLRSYFANKFAGEDQVMASAVTPEGDLETNLQDYFANKFAGKDQVTPTTATPEGDIETNLQDYFANKYAGEKQVTPTTITPEGDLEDNLLGYFENKYAGEGQVIPTTATPEGDLEDNLLSYYEDKYRGPALANVAPMEDKNLAAGALEAIQKKQEIAESPGAVAASVAPQKKKIVIQNPLVDQRMYRSYAENKQLMGDPRGRAAKGGRIGYGSGLKVLPKIDITQSSSTPVEGIDVGVRDTSYGGSGIYQGDKAYVGGDYMTGNVKVDVQKEGETLFKDTMSKDDMKKLYIGLGQKEGNRVEVGTDTQGNYTFNIVRSFNQGGRASLSNGGLAKILGV